MRAGVLGHGGDTDPEDVAFIPITIGLAILIPSVLMLLGEKDEPRPKSADPASPPNAASPPDPAQDPTAEVRARDRARAWELTQQAAAAARAGDCVRPAQIGAEVAALDAEFHATVFARDAAIARCLQPTPP